MRSILHRMPPRLRWRRLILAFATVAAMLVGANTASAYNLEGHKWGGTPNSGCCAKIYYNNGGFHYGNDGPAMTAVINTWNGSAANVLWVGNGSPNMTVKDVYDSSALWDGMTVTSWLSNGTFSYVTSEMNGYYTAAYPGWVAEGVASHELGHALGLAHAGGCVIMTAYTTTREACKINSPNRTTSTASTLCTDSS